MQDLIVALLLVGVFVYIFVFRFLSYLDSDSGEPLDDTPPKTRTQFEQERTKRKEQHE